MLEVFIRSFYEVSKQFLRTSFHLLKFLAGQIRLLIFLVPNSMSGKTRVVQRRIKNYTSRAIYINYRYHLECQRNTPRLLIVEF